jgi:1-deoxy-D-xylulose-5-phosphate reductoisomerase
MVAVSAPRDVVILGSTGSIGTQALDVVRRNRDRFRVVALAAGGAHLELLADQAVEFGVEAVGVSSGSAADVEAAIAARAARAGWTDRPAPKILAGPDAASEIAAWPLDGEPTELSERAERAERAEPAERAAAGVVLNGMTGSIGLAPTLAALRAGRTLALANKESLIVGGPLVKALAKPGQIVPVDSEHSALAQCLRAGERMEVRRLILTASGGPFRGRRRADLAQVTPEQALAHPTWKMGPVVTINSATLVNKALEVIEAHLLFDLPLDRIDVVVHPQSVVHSMVEFADGSTLAQCSPPDMRLPIALGLHWPARVPDAVPACDWKTATAWTFEPLDDEAFPAVALARRVGAIGGTAPAIFNAANEEAVAAFLAGNLSFTGIVDTVERVVEESLAGGLGNVTVAQLSDVLDAETSARARARELISAAAPTNPTLGDTA